jgi:hypothetical protein|tara:strand:+ start:2057 stop:3526 length:1470 start_codon:yes stop_codon:yes gene_type:complete
MNILQIEDDLKGMPTDIIVQHLQNPTGLIPTYLAAGELNRREKMQVARAEAPQETVVDEIIQKAMPMGGMPMPQAPMPQMPMPRPEEVMVSDTITETGIAGLPAPNVGNYKEGGIVGYDNGGIVEDLAVDAGLMSILGNIPGFFMSPGTAEAATLYDDEEFATMIENNNLAGPAAVGAGVVANEARKKAKAKKTPKIKPTKAGLIKAGGVAALDRVKKLLTPKATPKKKPGRPKKQATPPAPQKGPLTRATAAGIKKLGQGVGPATRGVKAAATRYPVESLLGLGALGYGANAIFGESDEERAIRESKEADAIAARNQAQLDKINEAAAANQARLDAAQAKRDDEAKRRAYLALALGGAKTMAGQSPYALTNIGEGVGTGVAGLVELEEAAATRQSNIDLAEQKYMYDLYKQNIDQMNEFNDLKLKLRGGEDAFFTQRLAAKLDDEGIDPSDMSNPRYIEIENETIIELYPSMVPRGGAIVDGQAFTGA